MPVTTFLINPVTYSFFKDIYMKDRLSQPIWLAVGYNKDR